MGGHYLLEIMISCEVATQLNACYEIKLQVNDQCPDYTVIFERRQ